MYPQLDKWPAFSISYGLKQRLATLRHETVPQMQFRRWLGHNGTHWTPELVCTTSDFLTTPDGYNVDW